MTAPAMTRSTRLAATAALIILGIIFAVIGVIYETQTAGHLPSFFPGHLTGSTTHHVKHGLAAFALAVIAWIAAWFVTGRSASGGSAGSGRRGRRGRSDPDDEW
jgi:hypothetical protein